MYVTDDLTITQLDNRAVRVTGEAMMIFFIFDTEPSGQGK